MKKRTIYILIIFAVVLIAVYETVFVLYIRSYLWWDSTMPWFFKPRAKLTLYPIPLTKNIKQEKADGNMIIYWINADKYLIKRYWTNGNLMFRAIAGYDAKTFEWESFDESGKKIADEREGIGTELFYEKAKDKHWEHDYKGEHCISYRMWNGKKMEPFRSIWVEYPKGEQIKSWRLVWKGKKLPRPTLPQDVKKLNLDELPAATDSDMYPPYDERSSWKN